MNIRQFRKTLTLQAERSLTVTQFLKEKWLYLVGGALLFLLACSEAKVRSDLNIFMLASKDLLNGDDIYYNTYFTWYHYYYSVFFALVLAPFTFLKIYWVKVAWFLLNVFFAAKCWQVIKNMLPFDTLSKKAKVILSILAILFVLKFLRDNLHYGQVTILILYLSLQGLQWITEKKYLSGALFLALGIDIKILPLVFLPYLLYRGEWKAFLYTISFVLILAFLPGMYLGMDCNLFLLNERMLLLNPMNSENIVDALERSYHSLTTLFSVLLMDDPGDKFALPIKRNIANLTVKELGYVIQIVRLFFVVLTLYFLNSLPFRKAPNSLQRLYEIGYICLVIPLIFPHQQHYAFLFVFPAETYLLFYLYSRYFSNQAANQGSPFSKWSLTTLLAIIFLSLNLHFLLGAYSAYYDHFKVLTYGTLAMVLLLFICKPSKLSTITSSATQA